MRVRSTGLGPTEMVLKQERLIVRDGYFLLSLRSSQPVRWHIRILIDRGDVGRFIWSAFKGAFCLWLLSLFKKSGNPPVDY